MVRRAHRSYHVDLWMGPSYGSDSGALPVDTTPLFTKNRCTAHTY